MDAIKQGLSTASTEQKRMFHRDLGAIYKVQKFDFSHSYDEGIRVENVLDALFLKYKRLVIYICESQNIKDFNLTENQ